jgi:hypothetical protein
MATVPNDPSTPVDVIPHYLRPTPADFLQAAAIVDQRQRMAGDVVQMPGASKPEDRVFRGTIQQLRQWHTDTTLSRVLGGADVLPMTPKDK